MKAEVNKMRAVSETKSRKTISGFIQYKIKVPKPHIGKWFLFASLYDGTSW